MVVTLAAVFVNRALRSEGTVVSQVTAGSQARSECPRLSEVRGTAISFELARDDSVTVEVVRAGSERRVAVLARDRELAGGARHCLVWRSASTGSRTQRGSYRLRFALERLDRTVVTGERIPAPPEGVDR